MADKSLDRDTRRIDQARVQKGRELEMMQQAQNQFLAIQAERKQNLTEQRNIMGMEQQHNMSLMQGAQIAASGSNDPGIPQTVDPRTQAVMNKYGMGRPKFQKSSQRTQQVTKQNVVINNTTNNNTTNNVNAGGYGGPVQGRALSFRNPGNNSTEKFKVWLTNSYARQQQQATIRNREYEKREDSLVRSSNKMMRKLEGIGKTMGKLLDPRRVGNTLIDPLKMLFTFMGFHLFIKNWGILMNIMRKAETFFTGVATKLGFSIDDGKVSLNKDKLVSATDKKFGWIGTQMIKAFGGNPSRGESIGDVLRWTIIGDNQHYGLWEQIKDYLNDKFDERSEAIKALQRPDLSKYINGTQVDFVGAGSELIKYLSDVLAVSITGSRALAKMNIEKSQTEDIKKYEGFGNYGVVNSDSSNLADKSKEFANRLRSDVTMMQKPPTTPKNTKDGATASEFFTDVQLRHLKAAGLTPLVDDSGKEFGATNYYMGIKDKFGNDTKEQGLRFRFQDSTGTIYSIGMHKDGRWHEGGLVIDDPRAQFSNKKWYSGGLITYSGQSRNVVNKIRLSSSEIEDGKLKSTSAYYKQWNDVVREAESKNTGDVMKFTWGMDRIKAYLDKMGKEDYIPIPEEALKSVLALSDDTIANYKQNGILVQKVFLTIRRNMSVAELCAITGKNNSALQGITTYINTSIRNNYGGGLLAVYDYGKALLKDGSALGNMLFPDETIQKALIASGHSETTASLVSRLPLSTLGTIIRRSPELNGLIDYGINDRELEKYPSVIADTIPEIEFQRLKALDERALRDSRINARIFNVCLVDSVTGNLTNDRSKAEIRLWTIKADTLRKLLKDNIGINGSIWDDAKTDEEVAEDKKEDSAHNTVNWLQKKLWGNTDFDARRDYPDLQLVTTAKGTEIYDKEIKNKEKRDRKRKEQEEEYKEIAKAAEADETTANNYNLGGLLPPNAGREAKIAYLKNELRRAGIVDKDTQNAIIGNLLAESGLNESINERGGGPGNGIAQWTDEGRKKSVINYINGIRAKQGKSKIDKITDATFEEQVSALLYNTTDGLKNSKLGRKTLENMGKQSDLRGKTIAYMDTWEKPWASGSFEKKFPDAPTGPKAKSRNDESLRRTRYSETAALVDGGEGSLLARSVAAVAEGATGLINETIGGINYLVDSDGFAYVKNAVTGAVEKTGKTIDELKARIPKVTTRRYNVGELGPEFNNYEYYLQNSGQLPRGLSPAQWEEAVHTRTGFYPNVLTDISGKFNSISPSDVVFAKGSDSTIRGEAATLEAISKIKFGANKMEEEAKKKKEEEENRNKENSLHLAEIAVNTKIMGNTWARMIDSLRGASDTPIKTS